MEPHKYKILHISTFDTGGAWIATRRLHENLKKSGHQSAILVKKKTCDINDVYQYQSSLIEKIAESFRYRLSNRIFPFKTHSKFNFFNKNEKRDFYKTDTIFKSIPFKPDVIVVHWISLFLNSKNLKELSNKYTIPIIWYSLDMAPITGGCHYAWECKNYENNCSKCPAIISDSKKTYSSSSLQSKINNLKSNKIKIVASTPWLQNQLNNCAIPEENKCKTEILLAIDDTVFKPLNTKALLKLKYNIPPNKRIMLIGAGSMSDERKGVKYIIDSLQLLGEQEKKELHIVLFGKKSNDLVLQINALDIAYSEINSVNNEQILAEVYNLCDFYVSASLEDSGPMMINEAIMCGVPVVSFNMGIAPTLVLQKETGYLAQLKNVADLSSGIKYMLNLSSEDLKKMGEKSRNIGVKLLSPNLQVTAFEQLISKLVIE